MAPAPATRAGPALAAVPATPASGSRGERKETRARGKAGGHADFRQHSSCCLCYTAQPGKYTSRTAGVPRCLSPISPPGCSRCSPQRCSSTAVGAVASGALLSRRNNVKRVTGIAAPALWTLPARPC